MRIFKFRRVLGFLLVGAVCTGLVLSIVALMLYEDPLTVASRRVDTISMDIVLCENDRTLLVNQTVYFRNRTDNPKNEIKFHIWANAFREGAKFAPVSEQEMSLAFPNGRTYGYIDVSRTLANGTETEFEISGDDKNVLIVPLGTPLPPNSRIAIDIDYTVQLANVAHRLGWTERVVNLGNFYPVPVIKQDGNWMTNVYSYKGDPFFNALHNFNVTITKPRDMILASSGTVQRERASGSTRSTTVQSLAIRDWAAALSREFQVRTSVVRRVAVNYFFLDDTNPAQSLRTAVRSLQTFSRLFVQYPYRQLTVVQTDFLHGGMEFGEIVFISLAVTAREEIDRVIIHEVAHQWWYGIVGNDQYRFAWIDEGLAEFSTLLFFDENPDLRPSSNNALHDNKIIWRADYVNKFRTSFNAFASGFRDMGETLDINMNRPLSAFTTAGEYVYLAYVRGMLLFSDLEMIIGRNAMRQSLRRLAHEFKFSEITSPSQLINSFEASSGVRLGVFFDSFTNGIR